MSYPVVDPRTDTEAAARAARALDEGGIVAMPTETVYGLFVHATDEAATNALRELKGRPEAQVFGYAIADPEDVQNFVNDLPRAARILAERYWPGPLTLVVGPEGGVGVRCPDHDFVREVLRRTSGTVFQTSANRSGEPSATTPAEVLAALSEGLALLVDDGPVAGGVASSVVRVTPDGAWSLLREGAVSARQLRDDLQMRLLLVCTGNTCRSPMAEALMRHRLAEALGVQDEDLEAVGYTVASAGVAAFDGAPLSAGAAEALDAIDVPLPRGGARSLDEETVARADRIWLMTRVHLQVLQERFPAAAAKATLLDPNGRDVPDPIGGDATVYRECRDDLEAMVAERVQELLALRPSS